MEAVSGWRLAVSGSVLARARGAHGFTLVELVVAMSISAIVVAFMAVFIKTPMDIYVGQTRRADLVDSADNVLRDIARDVRAALPNSLRVRTASGVVALEMLASVDAVRYRDSDATTAPADELDLAAPDAQFKTIGAFADLVRSGGAFTAPDPANNVPRHYLAIYNVGVPGADAYELTNVITPANTTIQITSSGADEDQVTITPAFRFAYGSPARRVFLVSGPVTYLCDTNAQTITRFSQYQLAANQAQRDSESELIAAGARRELIARNVAACNFNYTAGAAERAALLTMDVTLSREGEIARLLHQAHVENAP